MQIDPTEQTHAQNYRFVTGLIVPRPVAWITSISTEGVVNLAPFSAYAMAGHRPPMLVVSIGMHEGSTKDTFRNIMHSGEFVVNVAVFDDAADVQVSSLALQPEESEVDRLGLSVLPSTKIAVPRLSHVAAAMECRLRDHISYQDADNAILVADIVLFHIRDGLLTDGKLETDRLDPLARIAGPNYAALDFARRANHEI